MMLSEHFSKAEAEHSDKAIELGIPNEMTVEDIARAVVLAEMILEPLRDIVKRAFTPSSWFRSPALNRHPKIKGDPKSQHLRAEAADINVEGFTPEEIFDIIRKNLPFDQVIQENDQWVHVSYRKNPRGQALRGRPIKNGKMIYESVL